MYRLLGDKHPFPILSRKSILLYLSNKMRKKFSRILGNN